MAPPPSRDRRLDRFFDYAVDLLCVGDLFGYFLRANRSTVEILGFTEEELHEIRFTDLVHPDDRRRATREYVVLSRGKPTRRLEVRYRCKSGDYKWIAWTAWSDLKEGLIYAVGRYVGDERRRNRETSVLNRIRDELWSMRSDEDLDHVLVAIREGLDELGVDYDRCGINMIVSEDPPAVRAHNMQEDGSWAEADVEGIAIIFDTWRRRELSYRADLQHDDPNNERDVFRRFFDSEVRSVVDVPFSHGTLAASSARPDAFDEAQLGTLQRFAAVLSESFRRREDLRRLETSNREMADEIARRELAESQLRQAHEVAVEASQSKSAFLANTSHEIRTPINAIMGMAQVLEEESLSPQQADYVRTILQASASLSGIVDDILDLSKIEAGQLELEAIGFSPPQVVEEARRTLASRAQEKNIELSVQIDASVPATLTGDPGRLRQILLNLLSNAVKFTDEGGVTVQVMARCREDSCELEVAVTDSGVGIPPDRQEVIFTPFMQADSSTTRTYGGTGLGLSICRRFVEMMGGRIWVDSQPGQGSTFRFTAHFGASSPTMVAPEVVEATTHATQPLRILLVEDNALNRKVVHALLRNDGHEIVEAHNGRLAVDAFDPDRFDVVLMDLQMPEMDGYEATRQIRRLEADTGGRRIPIIALTAHAMRGDAERSRAAGMDAHLTKPVRKEKLRAALAGVDGQDRAVPSNGSTGFDPSVLEELRDLEEAGEFSVREHIDLFLDDSAQRLQRLRQSVVAGDSKAVHFEAHTLKGACREVGAAAAAEVAHMLEQKGRADDLTGATDILDQLENSYDDIVLLLRDYRDKRLP